MAGAVCFTGLEARTQALLDQFLENRGERGPNPDYAEDVDSLRDLIRKTVRASVEIQGGYNEGGGGSWKDRALITLGIAFIVGGILMFRELGQVETKVDNLQSQVQRIQALVEPRYRGG